MDFSFHDVHLDIGDLVIQRLIVDTEALMRLSVA